jgi:hypothetical protein
LLVLSTKYDFSYTTVLRYCVFALLILCCCSQALDRILLQVRSTSKSGLKEQAEDAKVEHVADEAEQACCASASSS